MVGGRGDDGAGDGEDDTAHQPLFPQQERRGEDRLSHAFPAGEGRRKGPGKIQERPPFLYLSWIFPGPFLRFRGQGISSANIATRARARL